MMIKVDLRLCFKELKRGKIKCIHFNNQMKRDEKPRSNQTDTNFQYWVNIKMEKTSGDLKLN